MLMVYNKADCQATETHTTDFLYTATENYKVPATQYKTTKRSLIYSSTTFSNSCHGYILLQSRKFTPSFQQ